MGLPETSLMLGTSLSAASAIGGFILQLSVRYVNNIRETVTPVLLPYPRYPVAIMISVHAMVLNAALWFAVSYATAVLTNEFATPRQIDASLPPLSWFGYVIWFLLAWILTGVLLAVSLPTSIVNGLASSRCTWGLA